MILFRYYYFTHDCERIHMTSKKGLIRLDKLIADRTEFSRRDAHKLMSRGQVTVNGVPRREFDVKLDPDVDTAAIDGVPLRMERHVYIMLNKPRGVVCATSDAALPTVLELVPKDMLRGGLFPAGRLDKDTEGFVLITDDGDFAHRILAPKSHVPKLYTAVLDRPVTDEVIEGFAGGVTLDGVRCMPAELSVAAPNGLIARVVLRQGMYHQVKRMFLAFGITVVELRRDKIGGLELDPALKTGECRELSEIELEKIEAK